MGDLKLFHVNASGAQQLPGKQSGLEKSLQTLMEANLETLLGVRFLATEYSTGKKHGGRIDTLGLDEDGGPVIIEYKRHTDENVINQGLFYLDWLLDHKAEFQLLVADKLGQQVATAIDWKNPRLVCIAGDFTRYDEHAVAQINRSIDLVRYRHYPGELLALELLTATSAKATAAGLVPPTLGGGGSGKTSPPTKTVSDYYAQADATLRGLCDDLDASLISLGDDVTKKTTQLYFAYRRIKNFACVEVHPNNKQLLVYLKVNPDNVTLEMHFTRDVRKIGHFGTGDLEVRIMSAADLVKAEPLFLQSYNA